MIPLHPRFMNAGKYADRFGFWNLLPLDIGARLKSIGAIRQSGACLCFTRPSEPSPCRVNCLGLHNLAPGIHHHQFHPRGTIILRHGELGKGAFTAKCALATTRNSGNWNIGAKIICDTLALLLGCGVQKPHQHKERHHRGHKIRIGHFPRAAVMTIPANNLFPFNDNGAIFQIISHRRHPHSQRQSLTSP